jgi:glyoxylase I family protein
MELVHHVSLNVPDLAEAEPFYVDVLGLDKINRPELGVPGAWLTTRNGTQIHLIEVPGFEPPKGQHFAFGVLDIDAERSRLMERGVRVSEAKSVGGTSARQCFFHDPCGNMIELNQPG